MTEDFFQYKQQMESLVETYFELLSECKDSLEKPYLGDMQDISERLKESREKLTGIMQEAETHYEREHTKAVHHEVESMAGDLEAMERREW